MRYPLLQSKEMLPSEGRWTYIFIVVFFNLPSCFLALDTNALRKSIYKRVDKCSHNKKEVQEKWKTTEEIVFREMRKVDLWRTLLLVSISKWHIHGPDLRQGVINHIQDREVTAKIPDKLLGSIHACKTCLHNTRQALKSEITFQSLKARWNLCLSPARLIVH